MFKYVNWSTVHAFIKYIRYYMLSVVENSPSVNGSFLPISYGTCRKNQGGKNNSNKASSYHYFTERGNE